MIIINSIDSAIFELNGIEYPRNFMSIKQGTNSVAIHSAYDSKYQLLGSTRYDQITVDGTIYSNQADCISALATILFAKNIIIENPDTIPSTALSLDSKSTLVDSDIALIGDSSDSLKIKKTTWINAWTNYLKGKVDAVLATFKTTSFIDFTSSGQNQLDSKIPLYEKGIPNGVATLGSDGKVPNSQIPALAISNTFVCNSESEMLSLSTAEIGDVSVRLDLSKTFILRNSAYNLLVSWQELLSPTDAVSSVDGQVGNVNLSGIYALDSNTVHKTGNESINGEKTFTSDKNVFQSKVGVYNANPTFDLDVNGTGRFASKLYANNGIELTSGGNGDTNLLISSTTAGAFSSVDIRGNGIGAGQSLLFGQYADGNAFFFNAGNKELGFFTNGIKRFKTDSTSTEFYNPVIVSNNLSVSGSIYPFNGSNIVGFSDNGVTEKFRIESATGIATFKGTVSADAGFKTDWSNGAAEFATDYAAPDIKGIFFDTQGNGIQVPDTSYAAFIVNPEEGFNLSHQVDTDYCIIDSGIGIININTSQGVIVNSTVTGADATEYNHFVTKQQLDENVALAIPKDNGTTYDTDYIKTVTQAEYDAIVTLDPATLYFII